MSDEKQKELDELKTNLTAWLKTKMPEAENLEITELEKPGMGLSSITMLLEVAWEEGGKPKSQGMVLRGEPTGGIGVFPEYDVSLQYRIMKALEPTPVPVAKMLWLEDDTSITGSRFFMMSRFEGEVPQDFPSYHGSGMYFDATPEERAQIWWKGLDALVAVHKQDYKQLGIDFLQVPGPGTGPIDQQLAYWERYLNFVRYTPDEAHPTYEAALEWLKANTYEPTRVGLCWGDSRIGNTLFDHATRDVLAVMDWEMAFIGDREADLIWFITLDRQHSSGYGAERLPGSPDYEETIRRYEELTGWKVEHREFNEIWACFRYGLTTVSVMRKFRTLGIPFELDMVWNSFATQRLCELMGLPAPGPKPNVGANVETDFLTVQFHFTGDGAADWYVVSDKGAASRHDGEVENANCTITVSRADWEAIRSGELDRMEAWSSGRMTIDGDLNVMVQLQDTISGLAE